MTMPRDPDRLIQAFLAEGQTELPDRTYDAVRDDIDRTRQRVVIGPWREPRMNTFAKILVAAAAVVVVALAGVNLLSRTESVGAPSPSPSPAASPAAFRNGPLSAGAYVMTPFTGVPPDTSGLCMAADPSCTESPADDSIRLTFTVPAGYEGRPLPLIWGLGGDTGMIILRGGRLYSDPCHSTPPPDIAVGPAVDDFANAIAAHPLLDATTPVAVTLAGYSGKYIDLQLPADVSGCTNGQFYPWEPGLYAQGPGHRWHLWILDVGGVRVVIQSMDYANTSAERRAELQAIVDSIQIEP